MRTAFGLFIVWYAPNVTYQTTSLDDAFDFILRNC